MLPCKIQNASRHTFQLLFLILQVFCSFVTLNGCKLRLGLLWVNAIWFFFLWQGALHALHAFGLFTMLLVSEKKLLGMCNSSNVQAWEIFWTMVPRQSYILNLQVYLSICPGSFQALPGPLFFCFFLFFFYGFCFLCQLNCPDLCFFVFFCFWWVLFSVFFKLPSTFFFFFFDGFCFLWQLLLDRCIMHQVHTSRCKWWRNSNWREGEKKGMWVKKLGAT